jgi:hypothetical protein
VPNRLKKIELTALVDKSGSDEAKVSSDGAEFDFYKLGATVSTTGPTVIGANTAISVYNAGRLQVGDTVQKGTDSTATATVDTITSPTAIILDSATGTLSLSRGDRLVVTSDRPTIYDESSGVHAATGSPTIVANSEGQIAVYSHEPFVDVIVSGGTPALSDTLLPDVQAGYDEPRPHLDIRDYDNNLALAYAALPSTGGTIYLPAGTYDLAANLSVTKAGTRIVGEHDGCVTIRSTAANPGYHLITVGTSNVFFSNFTLDGRATSTGNFDCLHMESGVFPPFNNRFENLHIINARRSNLYALGCFDTIFRDCDFNYAFDHSVYLDDDGAGNAMTHVIFDNCEFDANDVSTVAPTAPLDKAAVRIASSSHGVRFMFCRWESNRGGTGVVSANGLYATSCPGLVLIGCHFEVAGDSGSDYYPTNRPECYVCLEGSSGALILGCTFQGSDTAAVKPHEAVLGYNADQCVVMGGRIQNMQTYLTSWDPDSSNVTIIDPITAGTPATNHNLPDASTRIFGGVRVPRYADTTARDAAGGARAENGNIIYLESSNKFQGYAAGAWADLH